MSSTSLVPSSASYQTYTMYDIMVICLLVATSIVLYYRNLWSGSESGAPIVRSLIPWVGDAIPYGKDPMKYFARCRYGRFLNCVVSPSDPSKGNATDLHSRCSSQGEPSQSSVTRRGSTAFFGTRRKRSIHIRFIYSSHRLSEESSVQPISFRSSINDFSLSSRDRCLATRWIISFHL